MSVQHAGSTSMRRLAYGSTCNISTGKVGSGQDFSCHEVMVLLRHSSQVADRQHPVVLQHTMKLQL